MVGKRSRHNSRRVFLHLLLIVSLLVTCFPFLHAEAASGDGDIVQILQPDPKAIVKDYTGLNMRYADKVTVKTGSGTTHNIGVDWTDGNLNKGIPGVYEASGTLRAADLVTAGITNTKNLIAIQKVLVREPVNIINNPGFEQELVHNDCSFWIGTTKARATDPIRNGTYSFKSTPNAQTFYSQDIMTALNQYGFGEYSVSAWMALDEGATMVADDYFKMRLEIRANQSMNIYTDYFPNGQNGGECPDINAWNAADSRPATSGKTFVQVKNRMMLSWDGPITQASLMIQNQKDGQWPTNIYVDDVEMIPLNVSLPLNNIMAVNTIIQDQTVANGTAFADLELPDQADVTLADTITRSLPVIWDESSYSETTAGEQTVTGDLNTTGLLIGNNNSVKVQAKITVQPGEPHAPAVAPELTSVMPDNGMVTLRWKSVNGATGYMVKYGTVKGGYTFDIDAGNVLTCEVSGLTNSTTYYFAVYAYNAIGDGPLSNELSAVPSAEPYDTVAAVENPADRAIARGYTTVFGASDLRLPETVAVTTAGGKPLDLGVTWDTAPLDLDKNGIYELTGTLELAGHDVINPEGITATQKIMIRDPENLLKNPGFEDGATNWSYNVGGATRMVSGSFVKSGSSALSVTDYSQRWDLAGQDVKEELLRNGAGEYYFGAWARLIADTASHPDSGLSVQLEIQPGVNGSTHFQTSWMPDWAYPDQAAKDKASINIALNNTGYAQASNRILIKDLGDVSKITKMAFNIVLLDQNGAGNYPKQGIYLDNAELIPLNVVLPQQNIVSFDAVTSISVSKGTEFGNLGLPAEVQVTLEDGTMTSLPVNWVQGSYDKEMPGTYTITGAFNLDGTLITNKAELAPTACITVRAEGQMPGDTYYFSTSGNDANDGSSESAPRKTIDTAFIKTLKPGDTVLLKRGDEWYDPNLRLDFTGVKGTASAPITFGAYGDGNQPVFAAMKAFRASVWTETGSGSGIWSTPYNGSPNSSSERLYADGRLWSKGSSATALGTDQYFWNGTMLYVKSVTAPTLVELTVEADSEMITFSDSEYITLESITFKGRGWWTLIMGYAPTKGVTLDNVDIRQVNKYAMQFTNGSSNTATNKDILITDCHLDRVWSSAFNAQTGGSELTADGICLRNAIDSAVVRRTEVVSFGHTGINGELLDNNYPGIHNCVFEDNIIRRADSPYLRAFEFKGFPGKCTNNIARRNLALGMTNSSHVFGENNLIYSNIFNFTEPTTVSSTVQPYGIDMLTFSYNGYVYEAKNNIIANNTFYNTVNAVRMNGSGTSIGTNRIVNNLDVGWKAGEAGFLIETNSAQQIIKNNGFWNNTPDDPNSMRLEGTDYTAASASNLGSHPDCKDNIYADPKFISASNNSFTNGDFSLAEDSPYRYTGLPISSLMDAGYTDFYGKEFDLYSPSIGAVSYKDGGDNLLTNPGFEVSNTDVSPWTLDGAAADIITGSDAYRGRSVYLTGRRQSYNGLNYDLTRILSENGPGDYYVKVFAKLGTGEVPINVSLVIQLVYNNGSTVDRRLSTSYYPDPKPAHYIARPVQITPDGYAEISNILPLEWEGTLTKAMIYIQNDGAATPNIYLDECTLVKCRQITSVEPVAAKTVKAGTAQADVGLPSTLNVTLSDSTTMRLPVSWEGTYNNDQAGEYTVTGKIQNVAGVSNKNLITASCRITVKANLEIAELVSVPSINVSFGTTASQAVGKLPQTAGVTLEDGRNVSLSVNWSADASYDAQIPGTYTFTGVPVLVDGIVNTGGYDWKVKIVLLPMVTKGVELLENPGFENGLAGWVNLSDGTGTLGTTTGNVNVNRGESAALVGNGASYTASQYVTDEVKANGPGRYYVQAYVKSLSGDRTYSRVLVRVKCDGAATTFLETTDAVITGDGFTKLSGIINITWTGELQEVRFSCIELGSPGDVIVDDASFVALDLLKNPGFEDGTSGWNEAGTAWTGELQSNSDTVHTGSKSLASVGRTHAWCGPVQDITEMVKSFGTGNYKLSVWARAAAGTTGYLKLGIKLQYTNKGDKDMLFSASGTAINGTAYTLCTGNVSISQDDLTDIKNIYIYPETQEANGVPANPGPGAIYFDDFGLIFQPDLTELQNAVSAANAKHNAAVEGTELGQYAVGSKKLYKAAVDIAISVMNDSDSVDPAIADAFAELASAGAKFDAARITDTPVPAAPQIASEGSASIISGVGGTFQVIATGTAPIIYSLTGAPTGVSIDGTTGLITIAGTVAANVYNFTVTASNGIAPIATQSFRLTVIAVSDKYTLTDSDVMTYGAFKKFTVTVQKGYAAALTDARLLVVGERPDGSQACWMIDAATDNGDGFATEIAVTSGSFDTIRIYLVNGVPNWNEPFTGVKANVISVGL
jgi:hypothetical protein